MIESIELIEQAKTNNAVLEKLLSDYESLIYSIVKTFSIEGYTSEDLMQEARHSFCLAVKKFDSEKNAKLVTFATLVIKRRLGDLKKAQYVIKRRGEVVALDDDDDDDLIYNIPSLAPTPEEQVLIEEERQEIGDALRGKLTEIEFNIAILFANGYTYSDIAKILNITNKQVDNALQRARKKLKE